MRASKRACVDCGTMISRKYATVFFGDTFPVYTHAYVIRIPLPPKRQHRKHRKEEGHVVREHNTIFTPNPSSHSGCAFNAHVNEALCAEESRIHACAKYAPAKKNESRSVLVESSIHFVRACNIISCARGNRQILRYIYL